MPKAMSLAKSGESRLIRLAVVAAAALVAGCASDLKVYGDEAGTRAISGVPIHTPELYVKTGTYTKLAKGGECERTDFAETELLPLGPTYYVNVEAAQFAKTEFAVKYGDSGNVAEISMNTEPSTDALKNVAELIGTIAPLAGLGVSAAAALGGNPPCNTAPDVGTVRYHRFSEWDGGRR